MIKKLLILCAFLFVGNFVFAQVGGSSGSGNSGSTEVFVPNDKPTLELSKTSSTFVIDGELDEEGWKNAAHAGNFAENSPGDRSKPPVGTDVYMTYDDKNLYIAFVAESDPSQTRANLRDRDEIFSDDYIGILLDTYGDAGWFYEFFFNPLGIQGELLATKNSEDEGFNVIHQSSGKVTEKGYQIEVAIPFTSLRFPDKDEQVWRATFWRDHKRDTRARYSWAATTRGESCFPCQFGYITGIRNIHPENPIEILPSFVATKSSSLVDKENPQHNFKDEKPKYELSLNAKYAITSSVTAEATYNPDFSQVESDAAQIDVNSAFALSYPERRPFFQEGSDLFGSNMNLIYTRTINNPIFAAKITGRPDRTSFVYFTALDEQSGSIIPLAESSSFLAPGKAFSNNFRVKQALFEDSFVGATITDRRYNDPALTAQGSNTVISLDESFHFLDNFVFDSQIAYSINKEPVDSTTIKRLGNKEFGRSGKTVAADGESFNGLAATFDFSYSSRNFNAELFSENFAPDFRADNGFIGRNDDHLVNYWNNFPIYFEDGIIEVIRPSFNIGRVWNYAGVKKDEWLGINVNSNWTHETNISLNLLLSNELYAGKQIDGIRRLNFNVNSNFSNAVTLGAYLGIGKIIYRNPSNPLLGNSRDFELWGTFKPTSQLVIQPDWTYSQMRDPVTNEFLYKGYIFRISNKFQATRELFFRAIIQYDNFGGNLSVEPLISYKVNPFTIFYAGSSYAFYDYPKGSVQNDGIQNTDRQYFMKFQYLFEI